MVCKLVCIFLNPGESWSDSPKRGLASYPLISSDNDIPAKFNREKQQINKNVINLSL